MIVRLPLDKIAEKKLLSSHSLLELGCCTEDCQDPVTHIALVEIKLVDGKKLTITQPYCSMCIMAVRGMAKGTGQA